MLCLFPHISDVGCRQKKQGEDKGIIPMTTVDSPGDAGEVRAEPNRTPRKRRPDGAVSVEGITIVSRIMISGLPAGESRSTIKWSVLVLEERDRLAASWKPGGPDG